MKLDQHQITISDQASEMLLNLGLCILNMECRTRKTITAFETARKSNFKKILIVTKKAAFPSIKEDIEKYPDLDCTLINYESVHKLKPEYDLIIADEYHNLGYIQKQTKKYKLFRHISNGTRILGLTATMFSETYSTAYSLFYPFEFQEYNNFYRWFDDYGIPESKYFNGLTIKSYSKAKIDKIKPLIEKYIISYTQKQAGFSTKCEDVIYNLPLPTNIDKFTKILKKDKFYQFKDGDVLILDSIAREFQAMSQIQSGTVIISEDKFKILSLHKIDFIKHGFIDKKLAIYYGYKAERAMLLEHFNCTENAEEFQERDDLHYIGQFKSKSQGVKLDTCNHIIFFTMPHSNLEYLQSRERILSKDKKDPCFAHFLLCGFEKEIYNIVKHHKGKFNTEMYRRIK